MVPPPLPYSNGPMMVFPSKEHVLAIQGLYKKIISIACASAGKDSYRGLSVESLPIIFRSGNNTLYHASNL